MNTHDFLFGKAFVTNSAKYNFMNASMPKIQIKVKINATTTFGTIISNWAIPKSTMKKIKTLKAAFGNILLLNARFKDFMKLFSLA